MTDVRHTKLLIGLGVVAAILLGRIFTLQVIDSQYKTAADSNSTYYELINPIRGMIYDRNGKILVGNKVAYDIMVTPKEVDEFDTLALADVLQITPEEIKTKMDEFYHNRRSIGYSSVVLLKQVPSEVYNHFAEVAYKFPGFKGQMRSIRDYPINAGGNLLGYVSEVNSNYIARHEGEYRVGDYAGMTGIEAARERELRGKRGYHIYLRNAKGLIQEPYKNGEEDVVAVPGTDVYTTIDADLQQYGQRLMRNKVGSIVAIEPSTGEILALVSSPGIDVNQLADIGKYYDALSKNPYKPMYNRAVQASYPPGSVFKLVNGLIGLQEGVLKPSYSYHCNKGYHFGNNKKLGCHGHKSPLNMEESIMGACEERAFGTQYERTGIERMFDGAVRRGLGDGAELGGRRILALRQTVDLIVEEHDIDVDVATDGVDEMVSADGEGVAVAAGLPHGQGRIGHLDTCGDGRCTAVDAVEPVGVHVIWKA